MVMPVGPAVNAAAIIVGALLGMVLGNRLPDRVRVIVFQGVGLCVLSIGMKMAFVTTNPLVMIFSTVIGCAIGEFMGLEAGSVRFGDWCRQRFQSKNPRFTDGMINASMLFCIGAMAIVGSFDEALRDDRTMVYTKAMLNGLTSVALASAYGSGVLLAAVSVFVYQGLFTMGAALLQPWMSPPVVNELVAVGGVLIVGIGLNLLEITKIPLSSTIPAMIVVVVLASFFC